MSPGSAVFQLWGLREDTSLPKASVSSTTAQGPCPEFAELQCGWHEATLRGHVAPGKVCVYVQSIQLLSKRRHIHSPGDGAKSFFAFPEFSAPAECDMGKCGPLPICLHMRLPSSCKPLFPGSFANWLLAGLGQWEVLGGDWGVGEARLFLPPPSA